MDSFYVFLVAAILFLLGFVYLFRKLQSLLQNGGHGGVGSCTDFFRGNGRNRRNVPDVPDRSRRRVTLLQRKPEIIVDNLGETRVGDTFSFKVTVSENGFKYAHLTVASTCRSYKNDFNYRFSYLKIVVQYFLYVTVSQNPGPTLCRTPFL